ncbi:MAG TPA: thrombospondin type 3 repeat-containing protein [Kofleriaceae bacterium]
MRRVVCLLVVGLAGCDVVFRLDDLKTCATCDAGVDVSDGLLAGDSDGDYVLDGMDNCPSIANRDQHNHDGDMTGDACDPCPHMSLPSSDADTDGDGLGNGCDPRQNTAGDTRGLFVGFYDQQDISNWGQLPAGLWIVSDGFLRLADNTALATIEIPQTFDNILVQVSMRGTSLTPGSVPHSFSISMGRTGTVKHDCIISAPTDGGPKQIRYEEPGIAITTGWGGQLTQTNPMSAMLNVRHMICSVGGTAPVTLNDTDPGPNTTPHVGIPGLIANLVAVDVDHVFIAVPGG